MADEFDDELVDELREAIASASEVSEGFVDLVMAGYDLATDEAELAQLAFDSYAEPAAVRAAALDTRLLRFESGDIAIEFEIKRDEALVLGTVEIGPAAVFFEQDGSSTEVTVSDGRFAVEAVSSSPLRFKFRSADGGWVVTDWVVP